METRGSNYSIQARGWSLNKNLKYNFYVMNYFLFSGGPKIAYLVSSCLQAFIQHFTSKHPKPKALYKETLLTITNVWHIPGWRMVTIRPWCQNTVCATCDVSINRWLKSQIMALLIVRTVLDFLALLHYYQHIQPFSWTSGYRSHFVFIWFVVCQQLLLLVSTRGQRWGFLGDFTGISPCISQISLIICLTMQFHTDTALLNREQMI